MVSMLLSLGFAFLIAASLTYYLSHPESLFLLIDQPNARSLHSRPTPASGGVAILIALILIVVANSFFVPVFHYTAPLGWLYGSSLLIAVISLIDDWRSLSPLARLLAHSLAATVFLGFGGWQLTHLNLPGLHWEMPFLLAAVFCFLVMAWMTNLYNFMDGMDGFAGGMAVIGFASYAFLCREDALFMQLNLFIVAATSGFLVFNFPPARIFMGDSGAAFLGFLAAAFALWADQAALFPLWIAVLIFSPFIVDATVTLLRRLWRGEKIWQAHKSHYYQKLVQLGWGHKKTVLWEYAVMLACSLSAVLAIDFPPAAQWAIIIVWISIYLLLAIQIDKAGQAFGTILKI